MNIQSLTLGDHGTNTQKLKNKAFCDGETDMYIAHSNKGYKITKDRNEIEASIKHLDTMAKNMLMKESNAKKALNRSVNNE